MVDKNRRLKHGTISGYMDFRCRCRKCSDMGNLYMQEYRETIFDDINAIKKEVDIKLTPLDYAEYPVNDNL